VGFLRTFITLLETRRHSSNCLGVVEVFDPEEKGSNRFLRNAGSYSSFLETALKPEETRRAVTTAETSSADETTVTE
jgi:hypothetical protein